MDRIGASTFRCAESLLTKSATASARRRAQHAMALLGCNAVQRKLNAIGACGWDVRGEQWILMEKARASLQSSEAASGAGTDASGGAGAGGNGGKAAEPIERILSKSSRSFHSHSIHCIGYHLAWAWVAAEMHKHELATVGEDEVYLAYLQGAIRTVGFLLADDSIPMRRGSLQTIGEVELYGLCDDCAAAVVLVVESAVRLLLAHGRAVRAGIVEPDLCLYQAGVYSSRQNRMLGADAYEYCALRLTHRLASRAETAAKEMDLVEDTRDALLNGYGASDKSLGRAKKRTMDDALKAAKRVQALGIVQLVAQIDSDASAESKSGSESAAPAISLALPSSKGQNAGGGRRVRIGSVSTMGSRGRSRSRSRSAAMADEGGDESDEERSDESDSEVEGGDDEGLSGEDPLAGRGRRKKLRSSQSQSMSQSQSASLGSPLASQGLDGDSLLGPQTASAGSGASGGSFGSDGQFGAPMDRDLSPGEYVYAMKLLSECVFREVAASHSFAGLAMFMAAEMQFSSPQGPESAMLIAQAHQRQQLRTKRPPPIMYKIGKRMEVGLHGVPGLQLYANLCLGTIFNIKNLFTRAPDKNAVVDSIHKQTELALPYLYSVSRFVGNADPVVPLSLAAAEYRLSSNLRRCVDPHGCFLRAIGQFGNYEKARLDQVFHPHGPRVIGPMDRQTCTDLTSAVPIRLAIQGLDEGSDRASDEHVEHGKKKARAADEAP